MTTNHTIFRFFQPFMLVSLFLFGLAGCTLTDHQFPAATKLEPVQGPPLASGLKFPIGITEDPKGNVWVTEAGSGTANDGQVSIITPSGAIYPVITGFPSIMSPEGSPEGLNHLLYDNGKLYILHATVDKLYIADVSGFVPGTTPAVDAGSLMSEDIGTFVRAAHPNAPDAPDSNPYNLTFGPDGDLYIVDAGGNAVVRRKKIDGSLSIFATFPDVPNPSFPTVGPPTSDAVPTGIVYNGTDFLVSTLTGFPFPAGLSKIYKLSTTGTVTLYKDGFSGLTDILLMPSGKTLVTEFGFSTPGRIASGEDPAMSLYSPAITPVDILLSNANADTYYVLYYGPGLLMKFKATN
ncbi:ScyD/ScyE family protein [Telluribacter sp. SYSU D00476]|uniref:ScyD/ScyE family protein n=1 Tax=Telluribacter sp. SYSU D00476 TaxID=2811430 RepID=UPI001FF20D15|nr:ScyD/ScyE family protein [Telluribacter sp. SYSU D00476]